MSQNIYLVGLMAVGKSTIGRLLADDANLPFYDSDHEIELRTGADIPWIFDVEGEEGFRDRESQVIDELTQMSGVVVATGGGVVKRAINRKRLHERGVVVHLDCPLEKLLSRTQNDKRRPLLQGADRRQVLGKLICDRGPLYKEIAHYRFVSGEKSPKQLALAILRQLRADGVVDGA